ncbi:hypothetical protein H2200_007051 [Cladophialophora chaetospira]|uniref:Uncharacterized protein n=1 Tax=Cladophialophora chaetospira TaxID=386627 RepID=A0AA38X7M2_9EURO|nr:hypothetical protein H2200_007051 [Cladophialophora chaetospira]
MDNPSPASATSTETNDLTPEELFGKRWARAMRRDPAIVERLQRLVASSETTDPSTMMVDADDLGPNLYEDDDYWATLELHTRRDPDPQHPGVYPGISRDHTMVVLSEHFNTPWTTEAQQEVDELDSQEDYSDPAFEIGDVLVHSLGDEAWLSKETFEIVGMKLEEDLVLDGTDPDVEVGMGHDDEDKMVQDDDETKVEEEAIDISTRTRKTPSTTEAIAMRDDRSVTDDEMRGLSETKPTWIYQLKPNKPASDLFMADIMFFKEDSLVFDAEARDVEDEGATGIGTKTEAGEGDGSSIEITEH